MDRHKLWLWNPIAPLSRRGDLPLHRGMLHRLLQWFFHPPDGAPPATLLIRLMAGGVFLWEGVRRRGSARAQEQQESTMPQGTFVAGATLSLRKLRT